MGLEPTTISNFTGEECVTEPWIHARPPEGSDVDCHGLLRAEKLSNPTTSPFDDIDKICKGRPSNNLTSPPITFYPKHSPIQPTIFAITTMADPYTSTREAFTTRLTSAEIPPNAHTTFKTYAETHQKLLTALLQHPAMAPNLQQTYMTPANSKNKIYFMYVNKHPPELPQMKNISSANHSSFSQSSPSPPPSPGLILQFDPLRNPARGPKKAIWNDVVSRTTTRRNLRLCWKDSILISGEDIRRLGKRFWVLRGICRDDGERGGGIGEEREGYEDWMVEVEGLCDYDCGWDRLSMPNRLLAFAFYTHYHRRIDTLHRKKMTMLNFPTESLPDPSPALSTPNADRVHAKCRHAQIVEPCERNHDKIYIE
ncbi:uncharacterized protein MYCFIDRAFT_176727 [Pseudocercospora fijiensis CIRAD86]|uniref:Uncharacterized protein n=1 Tax=Pseudocercospora fijiensis (strain CIRAD86) TaxID=383855 RepID=M3A9Z6_PSEFD|nr:uncharacterized protein MYCFIDRAFT_176727 [Pseudocercospora fijiensis CIRAD86]EME81451.1 hypothetical protein MYCFIDRAFT_176727 [Pseudocercospora fijiensis CIRAD86]